MPVDAHERRVERLNLRVTEREKATIEEAARVRAQPVSSFVLDAATAEARRLLSERSTFQLDPERWRSFLGLLDRPAMDKPRLKALLESPSVFDEA